MHTIDECFTDSTHVCGLFFHNLHASHIKLLMLSLGCSRVLSNVWLRVTHRDYCLYDTHTASVSTNVGKLERMTIRTAVADDVKVNNVPCGFKAVCWGGIVCLADTIHVYTFDVYLNI